MINLSLKDNNLNQRVFLVPCSSKKLPSSSEMNNANIEYEKELSSQRNELIKILENSSRHLRKKRNQWIEIGRQKINFDLRTRANNLYSPGRLFSAANSKEWNEDQCKRVYIISALFGIIRADNWIPYYDLALDDKIIYNGVELTPLNFWKKEDILDKIIEKIIKEKNCIFFDLLSKNYRKSIPNTLSQLCKPHVRWDDVYGNHRGTWLKENL